MGSIISHRIDYNGVGRLNLVIYTIQTQPRPRGFSLKKWVGRDYVSKIREILERFSYIIHVSTNDLQ